MGVSTAELRGVLQNYHGRQPSLFVFYITIIGRRKESSFFQETFPPVTALSSKSTPGTKVEGAKTFD
jgi:hypothetical protein